MMDRRELLKSSLLSCGVAVANDALGAWLPPLVVRDGTASKDAIVETSFGTIRGAFANGVYSFKGIHYGASTEPPKRFLPPTPAKPWTGVRDALEIGSPAPQDTELQLLVKVSELFGDLLGPGQMSENCLVLNVWTGGLRGPNKRPVMVWLHGGNYTSGSSGIPAYDGANLAAMHDVVVVGINHRLNVFGHLYLGAINAEQYADSGNVGMLDIILALQWVRANIGHFGGNPDNVTIFGESGGGGKVSVLMAMPSAKGLFHKAIVESGSQLRANSPDEAEAMARNVLKQLNVTPDHIVDLQGIPMAEFIKAVHAMGDAAWDLGPVLDGRSLPRHPFDPDAPAVAAGVPMLIGTNGDEARLLGIVDDTLFSLNESSMRTKLRASLHLADDSKLNSLIAVYRRDLPNATPSDIYFAVMTDSGWRMDAITQAERKAAQRAAPAYTYLFEWRTPVLGGKLRALHGMDLPFVFDNVDKTPGWVGAGADLKLLADKVSGAWTAFARTGNPNHAGLPHWPAYDTATRATMIFNDECKAVNDPGKNERLAMSNLPQAQI